MNFVQRIKNNLNDENKRRGLRSQVVVDSIALRELMNDYEKLDAEARFHHLLRHESDEAAMVMLESAVRVQYQRGISPFKIMESVTRMLSELEVEKRNEREIDNRFNIGSERAF